MTEENITYIDSFVGDGVRATISLHNLYDSILVGNKDKPSHIYRIPFDDFFLKYHDELSTVETLRRLPEELYYMPKKVSYALYGTTELWLSLLRVNRMRNTAEFCKPIIKVYDPDGLVDLIRIFFKREEKM